MNDADWDKSTYCDYANGIFTIPVAGWYQLEFQGITLQDGVSLTLKEPGGVKMTHRSGDRLPLLAGAT